MNREIRPYTKAELQMLADTNRLADGISGWSRSKANLIATEESVKLWGNAVDYWNPLFRNDNYALNTRWGGIIAAPFYATKFDMPRAIDMQANPDVGAWRGANDGGETEWFKPIRVGDRFRIYNERPLIEDTTEGDGPRTFKIKSSSHLINKRNELVCKDTLYLTNYFFTEVYKKNSAVNLPPGAKPLPKLKAYEYSDEDLAFIRKTENEEEIKGSKVCFWEDVNLGDQPIPVVTGPTTIIDMIQFTGNRILGYPPMREFRRRGGKQILSDPVTKVSHLFPEGHFTGVGENRGSPGIHMANYGRSLMARLLTNWMGDDGFLKKFKWKNFENGREITKEIDFLKDRKSYIHDIVGDTLFAKGIVTEKRVENNKHLVDFIIWIEDINGNLGSAAKAVVKLCSKTDEKMW